MKIQRLSWAGLKIEVGRTTILIDPLLDPGQLGSEKSFFPIQTSTELVYVLVTHHHADHYDPPTINAHLSEKDYVLCHPLMSSTAAGDGVRVRAAALHDPIVLRGSEVCVVAVEAVDGPGDPQVSWIVSGAGRRIIHCGDTLWHGFWWKIGMTCPSFPPSREGRGGIADPPGGHRHPGTLAGFDRRFRRDLTLAGWVPPP